MGPIWPDLQNLKLDCGTVIMPIMSHSAVIALSNNHVDEQPARLAKVLQTKPGPKHRKSALFDGDCSLWLSAIIHSLHDVCNAETIPELCVKM